MKYNAPVVPLHQSDTQPDAGDNSTRRKRTFAPWWSFEVLEWVLFSAGLTHEQRSVALSLRIFYWRKQAPIPDDDAVLAQAAEVPLRTWRRRFREPLSKRFVVSDGIWRDAYMDAEIEQYRQICERNRRNRHGSKDKQP